ncbi:MAG: GTPase [Planktothrix sp.]
MDRKINIAVAGHTNTGKTTLIRTLMKMSIGEVADSPNVSPKGKAYYFDGLQANFIDTPGFQYASVLMMYFDALSEYPEFKIPSTWEPKIVYDRDAVESVEKSDVVIYVGSLSIVPDNSYEQEIAVIQRKEKKIVGVLNQYKKELQASNQAAVENRIKQWTNFFNSQGIEQVVIFDAHWDNPVKIDKIYDSIVEILDDEQKIYFVEGLKRFKERQLEIRREACSMISEVIENCRKKVVVTISKKDFKNQEKKDEAQDELARIVNRQMAMFTLYVCALYQVAAANPTTSKDELLLKMESKVNLGNRLGTGSGTATIAGAGGAFIFGLVGATIFGILTGGAAIVPGALAFAQVGGAIGAAVGSFAVFSDENDTVTFSIEQNQMKNLLITGVSIIWGLSNNGYGREREVSLDEGKYIEEQMCRLQLSFEEIDFKKANKITIIKHCEKLLDQFKNEIQ